jgi:stearoyl-CoA desaturase (delta-9 desaturase)
VSLFDADELNRGLRERPEQKTELARWVPYLILHLGCLGVIWTGWSWTAVWVAVALYFVRMFAITAFYHRYFSHRTFRTSRAAQFVFAVLGNSAAQRGPIWWASLHRQHHAHSDEAADAHSPVQHGFYWAHIGWLTARENLAVNPRFVPDLLRFPELRFLDRFDTLVPLVLAALLYVSGAALAWLAPQLGVTGLQLVVWGFFISTTVCFHATCCINSLAHVLGSRRFDTKDASRNNWLLALLTLGEGWHNNHHRYPAAARQGFYWWEIDVSYYVLKLLAALGVIWDLKGVPARVLAREGAAPAAPGGPQ